MKSKLKLFHLILLSSLFFLFSFSNPFLVPGSVRVLEANAIPYTGGGYRAPTGTGYSIKIIAPAGHKNFKPLGLGLGTMCLPLSIKGGMPNQPAQIFFKGDTLELFASHISGEPLPSSPCTFLPRKGKEGVLGLMVEGRAVIVDIDHFMWPQAEDTIQH